MPYTGWVKKKEHLENRGKSSLNREFLLVFAHFFTDCLKLSIASCNQIVGQINIFFRKIQTEKDKGAKTGVNSRGKLQHVNASLQLNILNKLTTLRKN